MRASVIAERSWRRLWSLGIALELVACRQLVGFDDANLAAESTTNAAGRHDTDDLFAPLPPSYTAEGCPACIADECGTQSDSCHADAGCTNWLEALQATRWDPAQFFDFQDQPVEGLASISIHEYVRRQRQADPQLAREAGSIPLVLDFYNCVHRASCAVQQCRVGRDFACFDAFNYPVAESEVPIWMAFVDASTSAPIRGCTVQACYIAGCTSPLATATTDARGAASLVLPPEPRDNLPREALHAEVDCGDDYWPLVVQNTHAPHAQRMETFLVVPKVLTARLFGPEAWNRSFDPSSAYFSVGPYDCAGNPARDVTVEIQWVDDNGTLRHCDECSRVLYTDANGLPLPNADHLALGNNALVGFVPARSTYIVVRDFNTRAVLSATRAINIPGRWHSVFPFPASRAQRSAFPRELR